jgi:UDPglucose 6-dehydrogenase
VLSVLEQIEPGPIIVVVSTVLPGDCNALSLVTGHRIVYSPEFVRLGHVKEDMATPDFILIGADDEHVGREVERVTRSFTETATRHHIVPVIEAELAKIALNTFVTTKISYANMIGEMAEQLGADAERVCYVIGSDHRIGNAYLRPGGAYRGPCFPRDNRALAALASRLGTTADLAEATDRINQRQPNFFPEDGDRGY